MSENKNKIGLFYSFNTHKTTLVAQKIQSLFEQGMVEPHNAETVTNDEFLAYPWLILGVPTWFDGELPNYWDEFVPAIEDLDLKGKKIAIFGLGDQKNYPENFLDAVGIMAELLANQGAEMVGYTSADGYEFEGSKAFREGKFCGLALDFENQHQLNDARIAAWVESLKKEFK